MWDTRESRGYGRKIEKEACRRDIRLVDTWTGLEKDVVRENTILDFKAKFDNSRYRDRTV